jgi:hypothetical protein
LIRDWNLRAERQSQLSAASVPDTSLSDYFGNLGGPFIKDKVWFFLSNNYHRTTDRTTEQSIGWLTVPAGERLVQTNNAFGKITFTPFKNHTLSLSGTLDAFLNQTGGIGKPVAALSSIGAGLHQKTMSVLLNLTDFNMGLKQAIDAPSLNSPKYEADGSSRPQVLEGDFCGHLLTAVKKLGLEVAVAPNALASYVPRGYVISGYVVGAAIDPKGGYRAVATDGLNGRALAY